MGKNLKGKELGKGLAQRSDGRYTARFVSQTGARQQKYFATLNEARIWLEEARHEDSHNAVLAPFETAADEIIRNDAPPSCFLGYDG